MEKNMLYLVLLGCLGVLAHAEPGKVRFTIYLHVCSDVGLWHQGSIARNTLINVQYFVCVLAWGGATSYKIRF